MKYDVAVLTDVGLVRSNNEDAYLIDRDLNLFVLADGMGGYQKGEVASLMTCDGIAAYFRNLHKSNVTDFSREDFKKAVQKANADIRSKITSMAGLDKMGSTVVSILLKNDRLFVVNVGDSRAYIMRKNKLEQISIDHSLVQETRAAGIKKDIANQFKNIVTRAIGMKDAVEPDVFSVSPKTGDKYLLCSDGLHGFVSDTKIHEILSNGSDINTEAQELVKAAKEGGGKDNITVLLIYILEFQEKKESMTQSISIGKNQPSEQVESVSGFYIKIFLFFILFIIGIILFILFI